MDRQDCPIAAKLIVAAAIRNALKSQQGQRARTHDTGFARHVQLTPVIRTAVIIVFKTK